MAEGAAGQDAGSWTGICGRRPAGDALREPSGPAHRAVRKRKQGKETMAEADHDVNVRLSKGPGRNDTRTGKKDNQGTGNRLTLLRTRQSGSWRNNGCGNNGCRGNGSGIDGCGIMSVRAVTLSGPKPRVSGRQVIRSADSGLRVHDVKFVCARGQGGTTPRPERGSGTGNKDTVNRCQPRLLGTRHSCWRDNG